MTQSEIAVQVIDIVTGKRSIDDCSEEEIQAIVDRQHKIIAQVKAKNEKSTSKTNEDSENLKAIILDILAEAEEPLSIAQIIERVTDYERKDGKALSSNMVNAVMIKLGEKGSNEVKKEYVKKVAYFSLVEDDV